MKKKLILIILSLLLFVIALILPDTSLFKNIFFLIAYSFVGFEVIEEAIENLGNGELLDENFLMTIATFGAFYIGEYPEAVAVMLFYQIGEFFQEYAVHQSKKSIATLLELRPDYANLLVDEKIVVSPLEEVKVGDIVVVKPGEKVPLDGIVIEGNSRINTSALTGEAVPRKVQENDSILSGVINETSILKIKVQKEYKESTVSKILDLVENATEKKSPSENFIHKFSKYYTPIVVGLAVLLVLIPPLLFHQPVSFWLYRSLSFLVVSCPCALVLSIPLSFFCGIGAASKIGVLLKGSNYLEGLTHVDTVLFDKTGTLTEGVFAVQEIIPKEISKEELLKYAAHAEIYSNHPIAISLKNAYGVPLQEKVEQIEEIAGMGIKAKVNRKTVLVGNYELMQNYHVSCDKMKTVNTVVYVALDHHFIGSIVIADQVKKDAKKTISDLKQLGIQNLMMLTGDRKEVAQEVSKELEFTDFYAELLPQEKVEKVESFIQKKKKGENVIFVGDGMNDAPVLALSDIGIAMGGLGSDAAIESADVVIMTDEPSKLVDTISIAKRTMRIVNQNIVFAISVKIVILLLSALGLTNMWFAVIGDVGVTILAVFNALRVSKRKAR